MNMDQIYLGNVLFSDTKRNIIMDGYFTKLLYSNEWFLMNGIYISFQLDHFSIEWLMNKYIMRFYTNNEKNTAIIYEISKFEYRLLEYYKQMRQCNKKNSCILAKQMQNGYIKVYKDIAKMSPSRFYLKISGIWETADELGITYKIVEF